MELKDKWHREQLKSSSSSSDDDDDDDATTKLDS
jgi:hypothetical protein